MRKLIPVFSIVLWSANLLAVTIELDPKWRAQHPGNYTLIMSDGVHQTCGKCGFNKVLEASSPEAIRLQQKYDKNKFSLTPESRAIIFNPPNAPSREMSVVDICHGTATDTITSMADAGDNADLTLSDGRKALVTALGEVTCGS